MLGFNKLWLNIFRRVVSLDTVQRSMIAYLIAHFLAGFLCFALSLKWVVLPLSLWSGVTSAENQQPMFLGWAIYCFLFPFYFWSLSYFIILFHNNTRLVSGECFRYIGLCHVCLDQFRALSPKGFILPVGVVR